jgi:hypothetical protein
MYRMSQRLYWFARIALTLLGLGLVRVLVV